MRLLVLGSDTTLGQALLRQAGGLGIDFVCLPTPAEGFTWQAAKTHLDKERPDALLNLAHDWNGFQSTNLQSLSAGERLSRYLANYCAKRGIILLQPSSYLVFDGTRAMAYDEQEPLAPLGAIGTALQRMEEHLRSRCQKHVLLRFGWLLDESRGGHLERFLQQASQAGEVPAADDRRGSPCTVDDAARVLLAVLKQLDCGAALWGTYHYGGHEASTALALYQAILDEAAQFHPALAARLLPTPHELCKDHQTEPQHAVLSCKKILETFGIKPRAWRVGLADVLKRYFQRGQTA